MIILFPVCIPILMRIQKGAGSGGMVAGRFIAARFLTYYYIASTIFCLAGIHWEKELVPHPWDYYETALWAYEDIA